MWCGIEIFDAAFSFKNKQFKKLLCYIYKVFIKLLKLYTHEYTGFDQ